MTFNGEICQECGLPSNLHIGSFWYAPNGLWNYVMGGQFATDDPGGLLCPRCFYHKCREQGIHINFVAEVFASSNPKIKDPVYPIVSPEELK